MTNKFEKNVNKMHFIYVSYFHTVCYGVNKVAFKGIIPFPGWFFGF